MNHLTYDPALPRTLAEQLRQCPCPKDHGRAISVLERMATGGVEEGELEADVAALWRMMAQNIYKGGDLPALATRETLQNSVDSIRKAYREGVLPKGTGVYEVILDGSTMRFRDNGTGMTRDLLKRVFFRLAATGKAGDPQASGGFGAAKAVILGASTSGRWQVRTQDVTARSGEGIGYRLEPSVYYQGVEITLYDVPTDDVWSWTSHAYEDLETRVRNMLALSNVPDVSLKLNGRVVEPIFPGRRGSPLPAYEAKNWGPDTEVRVKSHQRKVGSGTGAAYVRLNGLLQFSVRPDQDIPFDLTFDVSTKLRPQVSDPAYPFNAARDAFNDRSVARRAFYDSLRDITREAVSSASPREYDTLIGDAGDAREREGADLVANELANVLDNAEVRSAFEDLFGAAESLYAAENARSFQPDAPEAAEEEAPATSMATDPYAEFRGTMVSLGDIDVSTPEGRTALAGAIISVVPVDSMSPEAVAAVRSLETGNLPSGEGLVSVLTDVNGAPAAVAADPNRTGESPVAVATVAVRLSDAIGQLATLVPSSLETKAKIQEQRKVSPFGNAAMVKISRIHFDRAQAKKFLREAGKYLPLLAVWDLVLRAIGQEAKILLPFRPGFVLDDTVRGVCVSEGSVGTGVKNFVLLHPLMGPMALYYTRGGAKKVSPQQIAVYLHGVACHEMAHLPIIGRGGKPHGHDEAWAIQREDLGVATGHLLPAIETAVRVSLFPKMEAPAAARTPQRIRKLETELKAARAKLSAFGRSTPLTELAAKLERLATFNEFRTFLQSAGDLGGRTGREVLQLVDRHPQALVEVMLGTISQPRMETFSLPSMAQQWARQKAFNRDVVQATGQAARTNLRTQACIARCLEASARRRYGKKPTTTPAATQLRLEPFGPVAAAAGQAVLTEAAAIAADATGCIAGCFAENLHG